MAKLANSNITTTLVADTLGTSSRNVGTLCKSSSINKFSRHKPYQWNYTTSLYGSTGTDDSTIKGLSFGMTPKYPIVRSSESTTGSLVWTQWTPPTSYFRLGDFRGYNHTTRTQHVKSVKLYNSRVTTSHKPIVIPENMVGRYTASFYGEVTFDNDAEIKLSDFSQCKDKYLTLMIGANINGLNGGAEGTFVQSSETLGQFIQNNASYTNPVWRVEMDTSTNDFKTMLDINSGHNIVALLLAPKASAGELPQFTSLNMWDDSVTTIYYNDSYATYGDGGEGGTRPTYTMYGHMENLTNNFNLQVENYNGVWQVFIQYTGSYPTVRVTSGSGGYSGLNVAIGMQYEMTAVSGGSANNSSGGDRITEYNLFGGIGNWTYVDGPSESPWNGRMGVAAPLASYGSGSTQLQVKCRFYIVTQLPAGATNGVIFTTDNQGQGTQTDWYTAGTVSV